MIRFCQIFNFCVDLLAMYWLRCMIKFKKDKISLLKALQELVEENIKVSIIDIFSKEEVSDYMTKITDKRRIRRLKAINRELDKLIDATSEETKKRYDT